MDNLQLVKSNQQSKYDEIIEYLKQDNAYWLENDKWSINDEVFKSNKIVAEYKVSSKNIKIDFVRNKILKNEIKYYLVYSLKNKYLTLSKVLNEHQQAIRYLVEYVEFHRLNRQSFKDINIDKNKWTLFLIDKGFKLNKNNEIYNTTYRCICNTVSDFINDFYDDREETHKDIWYSKNIKGVKIPASGASHANYNAINFSNIPIYYREMVKKYFRTIITKKSWMTCYHTAKYLNYFFNYFYSNGYNDGFLEKLNRNDVEKYLYYIGNERRDKNKTENSKYVSFIRTFLEYIQMSQYDKAPKKEASSLIFQDDIPKRELNKDEVKKAKFIPEPILKQLDNNIMDLDRPQYIPTYILLRESGWRGTDILNLRYDNCLEQIWNNKEQKYNYYLCGEITKTGIAQLKIPIRDKVAEMIQKAIDKAKELSTEENNPKKYLFNTYEGKLKGKPLNKESLLNTIKRLIEQKDIRDINEELYHFRLHSLRHTRAKEYVEQGMGISIIQQILGHQSLQMTVHYATVTENTLYEKWKSTEDLDLFRVNSETSKLEQVDLNSDDGENIIRYEYVKKNLDAVRVPFGVCFKPSKLPCKQQMNHCLTCASFCTTFENIPEYEKEIDHVRKQIDISERCGRELWAEKNKIYLNLLEETLEKVKHQKIVHKNSLSREDN
ncbi:tyrosine recombinase XerD [Clostridium homopropionicum DSM 5847]|uniref:Tyrosine recombinase XerD n=1 Tax=Clostridium homopropionicum DSM 5847 TaxID=1121318 RepID=A0A0L6Z8R9_9CLOT|nr:tyrosine-type recombinase/integrase [Clostridium homopropionicum]KOA19360.1 tyrosine recombinase XerD [Clostridium homopropionicum DSM 5847]SFG39575.1 Site-specific recombinase XerD [Clostridium homopropionicum]SFG71026.1 Site-specific recombinase XerD [Clostridium homopropionicum]